MNSNNLIINYHDACIYESDLKLLESNVEWLNDACINYQLRRLESRTVHRVQPSATCTNAGTRGAADTGSCEGASACSSREENARVRYTISGVEYLDPSVVSFFMHQLSIGDDDDHEEMISLCRNWGLKQRQDDSISSSASPIPVKMVLIPINDNNSASLYSFQTPGGGNHWSLLAVLIGAGDIDTGTDIDVDADSEVPQKEPPKKTKAKRQKIHGECHGRDDDHDSSMNNVYNEDTKYFRAYFHFDSACGYNSSTAATVATKIEQMHLLYQQEQHQQNITPNPSVSIIECNVPQQINNYDCGVHTLATAEAVGSIGMIHIRETPTAEANSCEFVYRHSHVVLDDIKHQFEKVVDDFILGEYKNISEMTKHQRRSIANDIKRMKI